MKNQPYILGLVELTLTEEPEQLGQTRKQGKSQVYIRKDEVEGRKAGRAWLPKSIAAGWALAQPRSIRHLAWKPSQQEQASLRIKDQQPLPHDEGRLV